MAAKCQYNFIHSKWRGNSEFLLTLLPNSIINELTPNIALMLMISANEMGRWNDHDQPYYYLWSAIEHALEPGGLRFESAVRVGSL
jgi:hypothetical protein